MKSGLPQGVERALLREGAVILGLGAKADVSALSLDISGTRVQFEPVSDPEELNLSVAYRPDFSRRPLLEEPEDGVRTFLNQLTNWTLSGRDTIQMRITAPETKAAFNLSARIECPPSPQKQAFRARLASHRAAARLNLTIVDRSTDLTTYRQFPFDAAYRGGTFETGYQTIELVIPPSDEGVTVSMAVLYDGPLDDSEDPHIFVADPRVEALDTRNGQSAGLAIGRDDVSDGVTWYTAPAPRLLATGEILKLVSKQDEYELLVGSAAEVGIKRADGRVMHLTASTPGEFIVCVDGTEAGRALLGPEPASFQIPARFLSGKTSTLSVWDPCRIQLHCSAPVFLPRIMTPTDVLQAEGQPDHAGPLAMQASHRYDALKAVAATGDGTRIAQAVRALGALEAGAERAEILPIELPTSENPDVSIVIPAHNQFRSTYLTLCSLVLAHNEVSSEVILVDDGSTDETVGIEDLVSGLKVVRNAQSQRFLRACNLGVKSGSAPFVALLNNDVEVTLGWLDELVGAFDRHGDVGLAGSKLIYPDGRLQEAGGIVWSNGNPWNYGNQQSPWEPRFSYAREADYVSAAAFLTRREVWDEVGGFSDYLEPMYFEDTDYAFKVRAAGHKVYYVPQSVVFHAEGTTSGTDTSSGFKRFQEVNRPKFKKRWAESFASHGTQGNAPDLEKDRGIVGRVLFVDEDTPRPDRNAGGYAAYQEIKLIQSLGFKVTFAARNLAHRGRYTTELERNGVEVIYAPYFLSLRQFLDQYGDSFDAIFVTRYHVASEYIEAFRQSAPQAKVILNLADLHFLREIRAAKAAGDPDMLETAIETRDAELAVLPKVDLVLSYSDAERAVIEAHAIDNVRVMKCPWVVETPDTFPGLSGRTGLSFVGGFRHHPNAEAMEWFVQNVLPLTSARDPQALLHIYGSDLDEDTDWAKADNVRPVGHVADLASAHDPHRIMVVPLQSGAGVKGKVFSALAYGIPCILSPVAGEGIGLIDGQTCLVADTPEEWDAAISRLMSDDELWKKLSTNGRDYIGAAHSFEAGRDRMQRALEAVDIFLSRAE